MIHAWKGEDTINYYTLYSCLIDSSDWVSAVLNLCFQYKQSGLEQLLQCKSDSVYMVGGIFA